MQAVIWVGAIIFVIGAAVFARAKSGPQCSLFGAIAVVGILIAVSGWLLGI